MERNKTPVKGEKVDKFEELERAPGRWMFTATNIRSIGGISYNCPCGCGRIGGVPFRPYNGQGASWEWDGNETEPTLSPSIKHIPHSMGPISTEEERWAAACPWHGHLVKGVWEPCNDF